MRQSEERTQWRVLHFGFFLLLGNVGLAGLAAADEPAKSIYLATDDHTDYFWTADEKKSDTDDSQQYPVQEHEHSLLAAELRGIGETKTGHGKRDYGRGWFGCDSQELCLAYLLGGLLRRHAHRGRSHVDSVDRRSPAQRRSAADSRDCDRRGRHSCAARGGLGAGTF